MTKINLKELREAINFVRPGESSSIYITIQKRQLKALLDWIERAKAELKFWTSEHDAKCWCLFFSQKTRKCDYCLSCELLAELEDA